MSGNIRTRDGLPFNFEDGLMVKGFLLSSFDGAKAISFKALTTDTTPTVLDDWIHTVITDIKALKSNSSALTSVPDQLLTDSSNAPANTRFTQTLIAQKISSIVGAAPAAISTFAALAAAVGNDPNFSTTIGTALASKISTTDLQGSAATYSVGAGAADAVTATYVPAVTAPKTGMLLMVRATTSNKTSSPTFTPNPGVVAPLPIVKAGNTPLVPGDIAAAGQMLQLQYDSVLNNWELLNPATPSALPYATVLEATTGTSTATIINPATLKAVISALIGGAPAVLDTLQEFALALNNDPNFATTMLSALALKAPLASPALTGTPSAPTAAAGNSSTLIATTAFVMSALTTALQNVSVVDATTLVKGISMLSTDLEALAGTVTTKTITPSNLKYVLSNTATATTTTQGPVVLATDQETYTGTNTTKAVTPKSVRYAIDTAIAAFSGALTPPVAPTLTGASTVVVGLNYTLSMTASATSAGATITSFDVSVNGGAVTTITATSGAATYSWPSSGTLGATVTFSVTAKDSNAKVSSATTKAITLSTVTVNAPVFSAPAVNATGVSLTPTLTIGAFSATGGTDSWLNTDWEIRTAAGGAGTLVWSKLADISNTGTATIPAATLSLGQTYFVRARVRGTTYGASAYTEQQFTTQQAPSAPVLSGANSVVVGQTYALAMSATAVETGATIASFLVSINGGAASTITAVSGAGSVNWVATGTSGATVTFSVTSKDSNGNVSIASVKTITLAAVTINTVSITAPVNNATSISVIPTITTAAFATTGGTDTHANTDWEIRTAAAGAGTLVWSSLADATNKTSITVPASTLTAGTSYYVRARHRGTTYGVGGYGENYFTTAPVPGGPVLVGNAGVLANTVYSLSIGATPVSPATSIVSFNVVVDGGAAVNVVASSNSALYSLAAAYTAAKAVGTTVTLDVTAIDNTGVTSSKTTKVITLTAVNTPSITSPATGATSVSVTPTLTSSAFATTGAADTQASTTWEIRTAANGGGTQVWISAANATNKTSIAVPAGKLSNGVTYYARCLYTSVTYGSSAYSTDVAFTTLVSAGPTLNGPTLSYVNADYILNMSATPATGTVTSFSVSFNGGAAVTVAASANAATYTYLGANTSTKTNGQAGSVSVTYLSSLGTTSSATTLNFTYVMPTVNAPFITSPAAGATGVSLAPTITTSAFSVTGGTDTHVSTDWVITNTSGTVIYSSLADTVNKTSITIPVSKLAPTTTYNVAAIHRGSTYGAGAASTAVSFTTQISNYGPAVYNSQYIYPGSTVLSRGTTTEQDYYFNISSVSPLAPATAIASVQFTIDGGASIVAPAYNVGGVQYRALIPLATLTAKSIGTYLNVNVTSTDNLGNVSQPTAMSVVVDPIVTPSITSPAANATNIPLTPVFTKSAFATNGGMVDTEAGCYWEIRSAAGGGGTLMWSSGSTLVTGNGITCTGAELTLKNGTTYYARVKTYGNTYGTSKFSADLAFTTIPGVVFAQIQKLFSPTVTATSDFFGANLAINNDGSVVMLASPNEGGTGYNKTVVFNRSGSTFTAVATISDNTAVATNSYNTYYYGIGAAMDSAGIRYAVGGNIGSRGGQVNVYANTTGTWVLEQKIGPTTVPVGSGFGWSCSMNAAGDTMAIGAPMGGTTLTQQGVVYIYVRTGTTWALQATLVASDAIAYDWFGHEVSISSDGNRLLIGSICNDAPLVDSGSAYIFNRSGTTWTQAAKLAPADLAGGDYAGAVVSLSGDGLTAVISAHLQSTGGVSQSGAAYVFVTTNGTTWTQQAKLAPADPASGGNFGRAVSVSSNGNKLIVGCNHFNTDVGKAYHYVRTGTTWTLKRSFAGSDTVSGDHFGTDGVLSADGNYAVMASPFATATVYGQGVAYAYTMD